MTGVIGQYVQKAVGQEVRLESEAVINQFPNTVERAVLASLLTQEIVTLKHVQVSNQLTRK